jgi:hypothetical protein
VRRSKKGEEIGMAKDRFYEKDGGRRRRGTLGR